MRLEISNWVVSLLSVAYKGIRQSSKKLFNSSRKRKQCGNVWSPHSGSDLSAGQPSLPVCYAPSVVRGGERTRLAEPLELAIQGDDVAEAQARERGLV